MQVPANFTQLLTEWRSGHPQALERLTPLVYDELRRLARNYMRAERGSHTLQATAVVHEAFLRLIQANVALQDRAHFFALASRLMRRVLVDHAKSRGADQAQRRRSRDSAAEETGARAAAGFRRHRARRRPGRLCCRWSRAWRRSSSCTTSAA